MMDCISYRIMTLPAKASSGLLLTSGIGGRALPGRDFDTACRRAPHSLRAPGSCALRRARQPGGDITKASLFVIQDGVAHFRDVETGTIRGARAVSDVA